MRSPVSTGQFRAVVAAVFAGDDQARINYLALRPFSGRTLPPPPRQPLPIPLQRDITSVRRREARHARTQVVDTRPDPAGGPTRSDPCADPS